MQFSSKSPEELFELLIDDDIFKKIVNFNNKYANDNVHEKLINMFEPKRSIGILLLSKPSAARSDIVLVQWAGYGCANCEKGEIRNIFGRIKWHAGHLCDNSKLNKDNWYVKVCPLLDALN